MAVLSKSSQVAEMAASRVSSASKEVPQMNVLVKWNEGKVRDFGFLDVRLICYET